MRYKTKLNLIIPALIVALTCPVNVYAQSEINDALPLEEGIISDSEDELLTEAETKGTCGKDVTWKYDKATNTLTLSGTGAIDDYEKGKSPFAYYGPKVSKVLIKNGITDIGAYSFYGFTMMSSLEIPASVKVIKPYAFSGCTNLGAIHGLAGVTLIDEGAFYGCSSLAGVNLGANVAEIGKLAFADCNFTDVTMTASLEKIGEGAFAKIYATGIEYRNGKFVNAYYPGKKEDWNKIELKTGAVPDGVTIHCSDGDLPEVEKKTEEEEEPPLDLPSYNTELTAKQKALIKEFVSRMYTKALEREPDEKGLASWCEVLEKNRGDAAGIARGFFLSPELIRANLTNEEYIDRLYRTFFDREPDDGGKKYWITMMLEGMDRTEVLAGFVNSAEFSALCDRYGIARGTMEKDGSSYYSANVRNFVLRNYICILGRRGESLGVEYWCRKINLREMSPLEVTRTFFKSDEFRSKYTTNEEFVDILYGTFLGRKADAKGKETWVEELNKGRSRDATTMGFAYSQEFADIMADYGLK